ncbi:hypothetical protein LINGRAHAP2_LOCUS20013, partial [Linum grandiflorum]
EYPKHISSYCIDACAHLLNKENLERNNNQLTKLCFSTRIADVSRVEVEEGIPFSLNKSRAPAMTTEFLAEKYFDGADWTGLKFVFFPTHGGKDFQHFYVFGVDLEREEKFILNSFACAKTFEKDEKYKPAGTRIMQYARSKLVHKVG